MNSNPGINHKVVKSSRKHKSIRFEDYLFIRKDSPLFTNLTEAQQKAIRKIEEYWINRTRNYNNWKSQKHWSYKKETVSARIEESLYQKIKQENNSKRIRNFIRCFLTDNQFRNEFLKLLYIQYEKDSQPILKFYQYLDPTDKKTLLIDLYPRVISGEIYVLEKELFTFYFTFLNEFSISYVVRVALIHYKNKKEFPPIVRDQVVSIIENLIGGS